jgi:hypothetical protein
MNLDLLQSFGVLASEEGRLEEARLLLRRAVVANTGDAYAQANARDGEGKLKPQWGIDFVAPCNPTGHGWDATPQQRFEQPHHAAPRTHGRSGRTADARRPGNAAGVDRLFGGNPAQRLPALLAASRKNQIEVSTRLAEQVLEALWELLLGFDAAERLAQDSGRSVLGDLPKSEEGQKHLYGGLITELLRLVFLLYAEDEELMPRDSLYGQHYSVSALADRRGAWASLLSLFRLVYDGGGADPANPLRIRSGTCSGLTSATTRVWKPSTASPPAPPGCDWPWPVDSPGQGSVPPRSAPAATAPDEDAPGVGHQGLPQTPPTAPDPVGSSAGRPVFRPRWQGRFPARNRLRCVVPPPPPVAGLLRPWCQPEVQLFAPQRR